MQVSGHIQGNAAPISQVVDATLTNIKPEVKSKAPKAATKPRAAASPKTDASGKSTPNDPDRGLSSAAVGSQAVLPPTGIPRVIKLKFIQRGNNPRKYFDPKELDELTDSVRVHGVIEPILVRPIDGGFFAIIAGERRYRAALAAFGEEYDMSLLVRECTELEAAVLAHIENTHRADMSDTEEARSAANVVGMMKGDRAEAARWLGWSPSKLESRLALMNCSESVCTARDERKIKLGHAELFASLSKENQDKLLPAVIERNLTISDLKALIEKAAAKLDAAIFDKSDCLACPHNSSVQSTMFETVITDGSCTNSSCYKAKTEAALDNTKESLKDEYPVIRIVRVGDNFAQVKLRPDGPTGVGDEQAEACRGCAEFGAAVSALPERLGAVFKDMCFNPACNQEKVAARIRSEKAASDALVAASAVPDTADAKDAHQGSVVVNGQTPLPSTKTTVSEGDKVKAYREAVWRKAMKKEIASSYDLSIQYLIALAVTGNIRHVDQTGMTKVFEKLLGVGKASDLQKVADQAQGMTPDQLDSAMKMMAVSAMEAIPTSELTRLTKHIKLDLTKHWKMDADFLNLFTKSEIQVIAKSTKLDKAIGGNFTKLFSEKKDALIVQLLSVKSFDYSAVIPTVLKYK